MKRIDAYWYSNNPIAWFFLPVSWVYCGLVLARRWFYRIGILKSISLHVPVVVIGNIAVGGTGKTPLLIALCKLLKKQGIKAGVVSRGYRGEFTGEKIVSESSTAVDVGDEPLIISRRTGCPVSVGKDRVAAAQLLLERHQCDVILSDDGLQHYKMHRDYEIAIIDATRQHGNGYCLPAGPLREPVRRLNQVDLVVTHGGPDQDLSFSLKPSDAVNLLTGEVKSTTDFIGNSVHAVAGIGHPDRFFKQLKRLGIDVIEHAFQDHHSFSKDDLDFNDENIILMTEKDAVKCHFYKKGNAWYIPVTAKLSEYLISKFMSDVKQLIDT